MEIKNLGIWADAVSGIIMPIISRELKERNYANIGFFKTEGMASKIMECIYPDFSEKYVVEVREFEKNIRKSRGRYGIAMDNCVGYS